MRPAIVPGRAAGAIAVYIRPTLTRMPPVLW